MVVVVVVEGLGSSASPVVENARRKAAAITIATAPLTRLLVLTWILKRTRLRLSYSCPSTRENHARTGFELCTSDF